MNKDDIENLLNEIKIVTAKEITIRNEKEKRGENFNIFNTIGISTSEVNLHSAIISELLNPQGSHGLNDLFLKSFINILLKHRPIKEFETKDAIVKTEFSIGPVTESSGGRIDIIIKSKDACIIIENKIYAGDVPEQILRYYNYAKEDPDIDKFAIIYLTLDGHEPSEESLGKDLKEKKDSYITLSYKQDILSWLKECISIAVMKPLVRETLFQYINIIKNLTHTDMEDGILKELLDKATSNENLDATFAILENKEKICEQIRRNFFEELRIIAKNKGLELYCDEKVTSLEKGQGIQFYKSENSKWAIDIGCDTPSDGYYYGITERRSMNPTITKEQFNKLDAIWEKPETDYPFGHKYCDEPWDSWDNINILKDMSRGRDSKLADYIEKNIINDKVIELLNKLEEITKEQ